MTGLCSFEATYSEDRNKLGRTFAMASADSLQFSR